MLVTTFCKSSKPFFNPLKKPKGMDFNRRTYSTIQDNKRSPIPNEIREEIKNNISDTQESTDNLYKWAVELSHSERLKDKERAGDLLLLAIYMGNTRALGELGSLLLENAPILSELKSKHQWTQIDGHRFLEAAARSDDLYAHHKRGYLYLTGLGGYEQDIPKAIQCFERAVKGGLKNGTKAIEVINSEILTKPAPEEHAKLNITLESIGKPIYNFSRE